MEMKFHVFLTSARDGDEWSALRRDRFDPRGRAPVHIGYEAEW
jgi:hypothetical protein